MLRTSNGSAGPLAADAGAGSADQTYNLGHEDTVATAGEHYDLGNGAPGSCEEDGINLETSSVPTPEPLRIIEPPMAVANQRGKTSGNKKSSFAALSDEDEDEGEDAPFALGSTPM